MIFFKIYIEDKYYEFYPCTLCFIINLLQNYVFISLQLVIHFSNAFDFQCPSSQHWVIRGKSQCLKNNPDNMYICLFDDNNNIYQEICRNKHYYEKEGMSLNVRFSPHQLKKVSKKNQISGNHFVFCFQTSKQLFKSLIKLI